MFWGLTLNANDRSVEEFTTDLHVSAVVLDVDSLSKNAKKSIQVWAENESGPCLIANVCRQTTQFVLDIGISKGEKLTFFTKGGPGTVYLHGYFVPDENGENDSKSAATSSLMNVKNESLKSEENMSRESDLETEETFDPTSYDGSGSRDEVKQSKRKSVKRKIGGEVEDDITRLADVKKRARTPKIKNPNELNRSMRDDEFTNRSMRDAMSLHGYSPYFSPWPPGTPFSAVHPEAFNYQQMIANNAFNTNRNISKNAHFSKQ